MDVRKSLKQALVPAYVTAPVVKDLLAVRDATERMKSELELLRAAAAMDADERFRQADPRFRDPRSLLAHGHQVTSQNDEDGMVREVFRRIGTTNHYFVEIGVGDGTVNNTAFLLSQGWCGAWVDANERFRETARAVPADRLRTAHAFVDRENAPGILEGLGVPSAFDLLSIDTDQNTYWVWQGLAAFKPRVAVIEYNPVIPPDVDWKVAYDAKRVWDGSHNYGASLKALENLGRDLGYTLVGCDAIGVNAFFVRADLVRDRFDGPFTAEHHYMPSRIPFVVRRSFRSAILDCAPAPLPPGSGAR
jgi:hypothetical protein